MLVTQTPMEFVHCRLPWLDHDGDKQIVSGVMHSHQLSAGAAPLLISLHAQAHLKLTKDMANGTIKIGDMILPTSRCKKTGLVMVNLTEGINCNNLAKCHRPLRDLSLVLPALGSEGTAFAGTVKMTSAAHGSVRLSQLRGLGVEAERRDVSVLFPGVRVLVTTRGERFGDKPACSDRSVLTLDCRCFSDPGTGHLRGHVGTHIGIIDGMVKACSSAVRGLVDEAMEFIKGSGDRQCWIDLVCTSGRHRSVGMSVVIGLALQDSRIEHRTIHLHSHQWKNMKCGGRCSQCNLQDLSGLLRITAGVLPPPEPIAVETVEVADETSVAGVEPTTDLQQMVQSLATSVNLLNERLNELAKDKSKEDRGRSRTPREPDYPPPSFRVVRPSSKEHREVASSPVRKPPVPPSKKPSSRKTIENEETEDRYDEPFNVSFDGSDMGQKELTDLAESKAHDFITWMGAENASLNLKQGVRINCKTRGDVWTDLVKCPDQMKTWVKTSWTRKREGDDRAWKLIQNRVPIGSNVQLSDTALNDLIVFAQPQGSAASSSGGKRKKFCPPVPPKPKRNVVWEDELYDRPPGSWDNPPAVVLKGRTHRVVEPDVEKAPDSDDNDDHAKSPHEGTSETHSPTTEVHSDLTDDDSSLSVAAYMAIGDNIDPLVEATHKTTMSRKQKKQFAEGLEAYNHHEWAVGVNYGFRDENFTGANCSIVTSHPQIFWHQDNFNVYDVGKNADHLDQNEKAWDPIFQDVDLVVVAVAYDDPDVVLGHRDLLHELETFADVAGLKFLHIDIINTDRWNQHATPQTPYMCESGELGFTTNDEDLASRFLRWAEGKTMDDVLGSDFAEWMWFTSEELALSDMMNTAFPAAVIEEETDDHATFDGVLGRDDVGKIDPREEMLSEETLLDEVNIPGLPEDEKKRRSEWRKLPQRVRIGIRRLHRQFGHVPKGTMLQLLRAARVSPEFIKACRLHRCVACESTARKKPTHKVTMPTEFRFGHTLGIDLMEVRDAQGEKYQVLNMVDIGTTFQLVAVVKKGAGQCSSAECLRILSERWFSWAGLPEQITCDRGLHNRGTLQKYMDEHGVRVVHAPLESPESIGRTERHGGLVKALYRKVSAEVHPTGKEQVEQVLIEVTRVKNSTSRIGGFSPAQWVLGRDSRTAPSQFSQEWADLGAIEAQADPDSIFALQHQARVEARKAFVHLDCSRRVQKALLRNAQPIPRDYAVGDLVCFRRDNQIGGTKWSPACRVIGKESEKNVWLLCGNLPVLANAQNLRPASDAEALARSLLRGEMVEVPETVVGDQSQQQSFVDARRVVEETEGEESREKKSRRVETIPEGILEDPEEGTWEIPDDVLVELGILHQNELGEGNQEEEDQVEEEEDALAELHEAAASSDRVRRNDTAEPSRNVRPRTGEPEAERGESLPQSRRDSSLGPSQPQPWPRANHLDDLPVQLRAHFERQAERNGRTEEGEDRTAFVAFMADRFEVCNRKDEVPRDFSIPEDGIEKKVLRSINYERASAEVKAGLDKSRAAEWGKYETFNAAVPVTGEEKERLVAEGHSIIPSKWVDTNKNEHKEGQVGYEPKYKSRLVSCGNYEDSSGLRSDSPTSDSETHNVVAAFAACHGVSIHSADVTSAYFQAKPLDRVLLMRQPRGGLPGVPDDALLLVRLPIYGLCDSGRGFWLRLDSEAREVGLNPSLIFPAFYCLRNQNNKPIAVLTTHVDDLLYAYLPEGKEQMDRLLSKFEVGTTDTGSFRYCGKQFTQGPDYAVSIDVVDNTRRMGRILVGPDRKQNDKLTKGELTQLRSGIGSLAWIARQARPDLAYKVSYLQTCVKSATVTTLKECNKVVDLAKATMNEVKLHFTPGIVNWQDCGVLTVSDASFSNEPGYKSQQGRSHFLTSAKDLKDEAVTAYRVLPIAFSSTTMKRVCRSTLQAEAYALQSGIESGDRIRALIAETNGAFDDLRNWENPARRAVPQLLLSDCRSLVEHLNSEIPAKISDKRLGIEMAAIRQQLWTDDVRRTWTEYPSGGDALIWISTSTMVSDVLTKSMRPDLLLKTLRRNTYEVVKQK